MGSPRRIPVPDTLFVMSDPTEKKDGIGIELGELTSPLQTSEKPLDTGNQDSESLLCVTFGSGKNS